MIHELVGSEVSLTTASLSADGCSSLKMPAHHGLGNAADTEKLTADEFRLGENISGVVVLHVKSKHFSHQGHNGVLLELVVDDGHGTLTVGTNALSLL